MEVDAESNEIPLERQCFHDAQQKRLVATAQMLVDQKHMLQQIQDLMSRQEHKLSTSLAKLSDLVSQNDSSMPASSRRSPSSNRRRVSPKEAAPNKYQHAYDESAKAKLESVGDDTLHQDAITVIVPGPDIKAFTAEDDFRDTATSQGEFSQLSNMLTKACSMKKSVVSRSLGPFADQWRRVVSVLAERPHGSYLSRFVRSHLDIVCAIVILSNGAFIGWQVDYARKHFNNQTTNFMITVDACFGVFYIMELTLRLYVDRFYFFCGPDYAWNIFDTFLVLSAIRDQIDALGQSQDSNAGDVGFLRVLRVLKMLKLLRMIRLMRIFRELRLIMNSIMGSVKALFWSGILISVVLFMFAIAFLQGITEHLAQQGDSVSPKVKADLDSIWGSLDKAILALYWASMSGEDWRKLGEPLSECGWFLYFLFLFFIGFHVWVIANTITSLFVEATIQNADKDQQQVIHLELEEKEKFIRMLTTWFEKFDVNSSGSITAEDVNEALEAPEIIGFAHRLGIEPTDVKHFFQVLTQNGTKPVDLETFVIGSIKLSGGARSMDLMDLLFAHRQFAHDQIRFNTFAEHRFESLDDHLAQMIEKLDGLDIIFEEQEARPKGMCNTLLECDLGTSFSASLAL